ncbi:MAG: serine/threonine protein kinase, partial [Arenibacterium sp.]
DQRLQSAAAILAFLDNPEQFNDDVDMDATVITPMTRKRAAEPETVPPPPPPASAEGSGKSRTGLFAGLAVVVLAAGGAGGYFSGAFDTFLGPQYPPAEPFALVVTQAEGAAPVAVGNVPSEDMESKLAGLMQQRSGEANLTLASGDIAETWANDVMETIDQIDELNTWRLSISGNRAQVIGTTSDEALQQRLMAAFSNDLPGALEGSADILFQPVFLAAARLEPVLTDLADCGPLDLINVPATGYGPGVPITVMGRVAHTATRVQVFDALSALSGDRQVIVDVEVLNDTLCLIENHLPNAPDSGIDVSFRVGDSDSDNPSGRFFVGENPVIDVDLPADVTDGYLTVSILDVSGKVFHLLPNLSREENSVAALRDGQAGPIKIRVAYPLSDLAPGKIAFRVDDSTLGKSKVIVLHSNEPLFDGLRPMEESASGYAEALKEYTLDNETSIRSLDSKVLTTAQP